MKYDNSFWKWKPLQYFGVFRFEALLNSCKNLKMICLKNESTIYLEKEKKHLNEYAYTVPMFRNTLRIYTDHKKSIQFVSSEEKFFYNGTDLLKCSIEEIVLLLGENFDDYHEIDVSGEIDRNYFFEQLGLAVWEENNKVTRITASMAYE